MNNENITLIKIVLWVSLDKCNWYTKMDEIDALGRMPMWHPTKNGYAMSVLTTLISNFIAFHLYLMIIFFNFKNILNLITTSIFFPYCLRWCSTICPICLLTTIFLAWFMNTLWLFPPKKFYKWFPWIIWAMLSHCMKPFLSSNYTCLGSIVYFGNAQISFW